MDGEKGCMVGGDRGRFRTINHGQVSYVADNMLAEAATGWHLPYLRLSLSV